MPPNTDDKLQLVWLRSDLRLADNPALYHAAKQGSVVCVFIVSQEQWLSHDDGAAKQGLLRTRLEALQSELEQKNIPLKILNEPSYTTQPQALLALAQSLNAEQIRWNAEYPLNEQERDTAVKALLQQHDIVVSEYHGDLIHTPGSVRTQTGNIYHVFTPFARQWRKQVTPEQLATLGAPRKQKPLSIKTDSLATQWPEAADKEPYRKDLWPADSKAIQQRLDKFLLNTVNHYGDKRDIPSIAGTSTLSPYLACGALSSRQCMAAFAQIHEQWFSSQWTSELIWREFYRHLTAVYPHLSKGENFKTTKKPIPWSDNEAQWQAWCEGNTGYPIVDAAIKQLLQTGWMHNRLRMVVAAFLTKLLLIDWRKGEAFFMRHLIDADYASNNGGWQWAASTGADAAPYFRIFNPQRQSERFDPEGVFIKRFLPELEGLDKKSIHNPSSEQRKMMGYPEPIIDYKFARQRALDGYAVAMGKNS